MTAQVAVRRNWQTAGAIISRGICPFHDDQIGTHFVYTLVQ
jgi:hypothetical protein